MKKIFLFLFFMIFFNIAAFAVSSMNIFPYSIYGDATHYDLSNSDDLPTAEIMFQRLVTNTNGSVAKFMGVELTFSTVILGMATLGGIIAIATKSMTPFVVGLIGSLFVLMYSNSRLIFDQITGNLGGSVQYLVLMIGVGVLILFVITAMDYAAGQSSGD